MRTHRAMAHLGVVEGDTGNVEVRNSAVCRLIQENSPAIPDLHLSLTERRFVSEGGRRHLPVGLATKSNTLNCKIFSECKLLSCDFTRISASYRPSILFL